MKVKTKVKAGGGDDCTAAADHWRALARRSPRRASRSGLRAAPRRRGARPGRRHIDAMWPLWSVLDLTPGGRGETLHPRLACW